jgi:excisionase family DNA binding protein
MLKVADRARSMFRLCCAILLAGDAALAGAAEPCESAVLTLQEAADLLRIRSNDLQRLAERHAIPARRIGDSWRFNCASVMAWLDGDGPPVAVSESPDDRRSLDAQELSSVTAAGAAAQETGPDLRADRNETDFEQEGIGEAPDQRTAEDVLLRDQRILVSPRTVSLNFGQFYSENDSLAFASSDEGDRLAVLEQAALVSTFQARIGVGRNSEMFVGTSYANQDSDLFLGSEKVASAGSSEFGDVLLGARRTLAREGIGRPNVIGTLTARIPTGDSSDAISAGLGIVKSFDPVALFATANYTRTFSEEFADISKLEPEHRLDASFGFALAVNDTLSLSGAVSAVFTAATAFPNARLRQHDSYSLGFGLTSRVSRSVYLEPAVSLALGGPADGFAFGLSVFTFRQ